MHSDHSFPASGWAPGSVISEASRPPLRQTLCPSYLISRAIWFWTLCSRCQSSRRHSRRWSVEPSRRAPRQRVRTRKARPCFATGWVTRGIISLKAAWRARQTIKARSPCEPAIAQQAWPGLLLEPKLMRLLLILIILIINLPAVVCAAARAIVVLTRTAGLTTRPRLRSYPAFVTTRSRARIWWPQREIKSMASDASR